VRNVDPRIALEAAPERADLRARVIAGDPAAMLKLFESFQADAASLERAIEELHSLAVGHSKLEVAQRIRSWRDLNFRDRGAVGGGA
jgi:hypothetical protein